MPYFTVKYLWLVELSFPICFFLIFVGCFLKKNCKQDLPRSMCGGYFDHNRPEGLTKEGGIISRRFDWAVTLPFEPKGELRTPAMSI